MLLLVDRRTWRNKLARYFDFFRDDDNDKDDDSFSSSRIGSFLCLSDALNTLQPTYSAVSSTLEASRYLPKQSR